MARSVSTPSNAIAVAYATWEGDDIYDFESSVVADFQNYAPELWPSLQACDEWLGYEDHVLLENAHCYMGVSEYGGLVAYWIVPKDTDTPGLAENWCRRIAARFVKTFGQYRKIGTASNGEAFFEKVA